MKAIKITFKGGGYVIVENKEDYMAHRAAEDFEGYSEPTQSEMKEYKAHVAFMGLAQKYVDLIEEWVADRPPITERFRYDTNDIMNMMAFLMKNREPVKKREVEELSKAQFKKELECAPFTVMEGGSR